MRKVMTVLTAVMISMGLTGEATAQAQKDSLRSAKRSPLSFRLASTTPTRDFERMAIDGDKAIDVAPRAALSGS